MGNCCFGGTTGDSGAKGGGSGGGGGVGKPKGGALKWLLENQIIEAEEDVFKTDFSDGTMPPLHSQSRKGNAVAVGHLLALDKARGGEKMTEVVYGSRVPLHQAAAAKEGRLATCKLLIDFDSAQLEVKTNDGSLPVHMLAQSEDDAAAVLKLFLGKGGEEMVKEKKKDGSMLLHLACTAGGSALVAEILRIDQSLANVVDGSVRTCLHLAAEKGHFEVIQKLAEVDGIQFGTKDRKGYTCLALSAVVGHADIVKLLARKDPSLLTIRDREGKTPFDLCAEFGATAGHWEAAAALLDADPSLLHAKPEEPKKEEAPGAVPKAKPKLAGFAAMAGAKKSAAPEAPKGPAKSALHWAAHHGQDIGVDMLLALDAKDGYKLLKSADADGNTPLHLASKGGHLALVSKLLAANGGAGPATPGMHTKRAL